MMETNELLTVKEVAEYLRWNKRTVYNKATAGQMPAIKMDKSWRFKKGDIDRWLENAKVEGYGDFLKESKEKTHVRS